MLFRIMKRNIACLLTKVRVYYLVEPFSNYIINIVYISKINKWINEHSRQRTNSIFENKYELFEFLVKNSDLQGDIDYLEFGVASGDSLRWWAHNNKAISSRFIGFDTFTGLPEDWGKVKKGTFSTGGKTPKLNDERVSYVVGLFQETLRNFLQVSSLHRKKVIHLDADLYSSTHFVLACLSNQLRKGDILILDDFAKWRTTNHVFRAFCDFVSSFKLQYQFLGASNHFEQVAIEVVC
jgi:hypothetical protein